MSFRGIIVAGVAALGLLGAVGSTAQPVGARPVRTTVAPAEPVVLALGSARPDVAQITRLLRDVLEPIHDDDLKAL